MWGHTVCCTAVTSTAESHHNMSQHSVPPQVCRCSHSYWSCCCLCCILAALQMFRVVFNTVFIWKIDTELW